MSDESSFISARSEEPLRDRLVAYLHAPVDVAGVVYFRIIFGATMMFWALKYLVVGFVTAFYITPEIHFTYQWFDWVQPLPGRLMYVEFAAIVAVGLLMVLGLAYRVASVAMAVMFTHIFLIDKTFYQNHYYLITIVCWIAAILPAEKAFSLDALNNPTIRTRTVPAWTIWLLRFQVGVPYFYGGIAKLNSDWLQGQPVRMMLEDRTWYPFVGQYFVEEWAVQFFVYGGLLFDLLVVPALLFPRTRVLAFATSLVFHLLNATLFTIGVFPWFMMLATVVFFPPSWPRRVLVGRRRRLPNIDGTVKPVTGTWQRLTTGQRFMMTALTVHVVFQCLWPLRVLGLDRNPSWTENGHFFSWHMMLRGKKTGLRFYSESPATGELSVIPVANHLTFTQARRVVRDPYLIKDLCRHLSRRLRADEDTHMPVRVLALVSLNGRKPQLMIDPSTDLAAEPRTFLTTPEWVVPLTEPLRYDAWDVPVREWEQHVEIPTDMAAASARRQQRRKTQRLQKKSPDLS